MYSFASVGPGGLIFAKLSIIAIMAILSTFEDSALKIMSAKEAKNGFGKLMEDAQREPVVIQKHGRASAVVVSAEEYKNIKIERLRKRLAVGMEQAERGEFADYSLDDLIAELDGEV